MLEELFRLDAEEKMHMLRISAYPHTNESTARDIFNSYKVASSDIIEKISDDNLAKSTDLQGFLE